MKSLTFEDATRPGREHVYFAGCAEWGDLSEKARAGYRFLDPEAGTFYRSRPQAAWKRPSEANIKRGWTDLHGDEVPAKGRDRASLVVRMSLPMRSELLRLAAQSDHDSKEVGGFLFGRPSYDARSRVIEITSAVPAARDRERTSFAYDLPVLRSHLSANSRLRLVGCYHTHPLTAGRASQSDRVVWLQHLDLFRANEDPRLTEWLGLILAHDPTSSALLRTRSMYAWATRRDRADGPLTEKVGFQW